MRNTTLLFFLVLAGCSPSAPVRTESPGGSAPAAPAAPVETPAAFAGTLDAVEVKGPEAPPVVVLRDVRAASQEGFDRVVFELEGTAFPGYRVEYIDPPAVQCGSGEPVEVAGAALLQVRLSPAQAHNDAGEPTVQERERRLNLPVLQELESTCDFEADVTWVLGLAARNRFRVQELSGPARLVIDVQNGHP
jgi:hypothetical protein